MEMKIGFVFVALLVCANLDFCRAYCLIRTKDSGTSSAHIESMNRRVVTYSLNQVITDWSIDDQNSHLECGMQYQEGYLTVPITGRYYIYTQLYFRNNGRALIRVNNRVITTIQPATDGEASTYTGRLFKLNAGDRISVAAANNLKLYMSSTHSYFGAYLI